MKTRYIIIIVVLFSVIWASCNKKQNTWFNYNDGINASQNFVAGEQMMVLLLNTYFKSITDSALFATGKSKIDGADVYYDDTLKRILIEYPEWGNEDGYGHWRENSYEAISTAGFNDPDALITFVFHNFSFDKDTVTVSNMTLLNRGKVDGVNDQYNFVAKQINLDYSDTTGSFLFDMDQTFLRYKDPSSLYHTSNDSFAIWGSMNGKTSRDIVFTGKIETDSAVLNQFSCSFLKKGPAIINIQYFKYPSFVYFPDPDTCTNRFIAVINGNFFPYPINTRSGK